MHVSGIFPSISCIFLVINNKSFVIFVGTLSSEEELRGLGAFCVGGALESGEVLAKSLGGTFDCGDGGIQGNDTRDGKTGEIWSGYFVSLRPVQFVGWW